MNEENEGYNFRQYKLMESAIERYSASKRNKNVSDLQRLIADLDALQGCLVKPSERFRETFSPQWATLEEVSAMLQYQGKHQIDEIGEGLVGSAIGIISSHIQYEIGDAANTGQKGRVNRQNN